MIEKKKILEVEKKERRTIAVLLKNFSKSENICPQYWHKSVKTWPKGHIVWNKDEIEDLILLGAPIEVFYQDVDRTAKN